MKFIINKYQFSFGILLLLILSGVGTEFIPELRLFKYVSLPLVLGLSLILNSKANLSNTYLLNELILSTTLVVCGLFFAFFRGNLSIRSFEETFFIMNPILVILFINNKNVLTTKNIIILFYTFSFIYLVEIFPHLATVIQNPRILIEGVISSNVPTESSSAFILGFFVIYFAFEKKTFLFFLSTFLFLLAFKRIAIMGCSLVLLISIINYFIHFNQKKYISLIYISSILTVILLIGIASGEYDLIIFEFTGKSANDFLMGRQKLYCVTFEEFPIQNSILGNGLGVITTLFTALGNNKISIIGDNLLLHSDLLKIIIEVGSLFFIIWLYIKIKINIFSVKSLSIFIYFLFLLLTDNVLIYFNVLLIYYFIQAKYFNEIIAVPKTINIL